MHLWAAGYIAHKEMFMRHPHLVFSLTLASMSAIGFGEAPQLPMADVIMADSSAFASQIETQLRRNDGSSSAVIKTIRTDLTDSIEWRFHQRGRGILIAIPTKQNLLWGEKRNGELELIDIAERLISQKELSGRIEVVFIEPAAIDLYERATTHSRTVSLMSPACFCQ
jgi:hypothetical protein